MEYAFAYLLSGILVGASYRELGKVFEVTKYMSLAHTHLIILGFALPGIFYLLVKNSDLSDEKIKKLFNIYNFGIYLAFTSMIIHGLVDPHLPMRLTEIGLISISGVGRKSVGKPADFFVSYFIVGWFLIYNFLEPSFY